jgi:hypothetical protein
MHTMHVGGERVPSRCPHGRDIKERCWGCERRDAELARAGEAFTKEYLLEVSAYRGWEVGKLRTQ